MSEDIYWLGFGVAATRRLGLKFGVGGLLAQLVRRAPAPIPLSGFSASHRGIDARLEPSSVKSLVSVLRGQLADQGLDIAIIRKSNAFWITKEDADRVRKVVEA